MKITSKVVRGISVAALLCSLSVQVWAATLGGGYPIAQACCAGFITQQGYNDCVYGGCLTLHPNNGSLITACINNADQYHCVGMLPVPNGFN